MHNYILLADSGSTKTDWALIADGTLSSQTKTDGLNPFQMTQEEIGSTIRAQLLPSLPSSLHLPLPSLPSSLHDGMLSVHFFGAGCTPEKQPVVEKALRSCLTVNGECEVASDMLGAARAVCGDNRGIVCILGTGSNSCAYNGKKITQNVPPLGFILGDEGSGAVLGKNLVADILKGQMPLNVTEKFYQKYHMRAADIIDHVYRQPKPNTFLASFAPFLEENLAEPSIYNMVKYNFRLFIHRNVMQYNDCHRLPIGFCGSIAMIYKKPLLEVMEEEGMHAGKIIQSPINGLVSYYAKH